MATSDFWYENALTYGLDVETFMDSDGDGVGDFRGPIGRLDDLDRLGVDWESHSLLLFHDLTAEARQASVTLREGEGACVVPIFGNQESSVDGGTVAVDLEPYGYHWRRAGQVQAAPRQPRENRDASPASVSEPIPNRLRTDPDTRTMTRHTHADGPTRCTATDRTATDRTATDRTAEPTEVIRRG